MLLWRVGPLLPCWATVAPGGLGLRPLGLPVLFPEIGCRGLPEGYRVAVWYWVAIDGMPLPGLAIEFCFLKMLRYIKVELFEIVA